jgi:diguanylate cyclase (GGDEF)-like protein
VTLEFALLDFIAPAETHYSYKLEGFDKDWVELNNPGQAEATYTNLPQGHYRFSLRAWNKGAPQPVAETAFPVSVAPWWYETWWARFGFVLALLAATAAIVRLRTARLRGQERKLAALVESRTHELTEANRRLTEMAHTDPLTGLLNRRRFFELAAAEHERSARHGHRFAVILFDLDHFKAVNDSYGHHNGDLVLQTACAVIRDSLRTIDLVARFGGEEMVALLPETGAEEALQIAERVGATLSHKPVACGEHAITITLSSGIAEWRGREESLETLLARADSALYLAKRNGRDRAVLSESP